MGENNFLKVSADMSGLPEAAGQPPLRKNHIAPTVNLVYLKNGKGAGEKIVLAIMVAERAFRYDVHLRGHALLGANLFCNHWKRTLVLDT